MEQIQYSINQILPGEILREILEFFIHSSRRRDILNLRIICQKWRKIIDISPYWGALAAKYITHVRPLSCPVTSYETFLVNLANLAIPVHKWFTGVYYQYGPGCYGVDEKKPIYVIPNIPTLFKKNKTYLIDKLIKIDEIKLIRLKISLQDPSSIPLIVLHAFDCNRQYIKYLGNCFDKLYHGNTFEIIIEHEHNRIMPHTTNNNFGLPKLMKEDYYLGMHSTEPIILL